MTGSKNTFLTLLILAIISLMMHTVWANCSYTTIPGLNFIPSAPNAGKYAYTAGVAATTNGFTIAPPAGSSANINFATKINFKSGVEVDFVYSVANTGSTIHSGFALMFQDERYDQRDGANQHLGYRVNGAAAIEFDFFKNTSTGSDTDCDGNHTQLSFATSKDSPPSFACASDAKNKATLSSHAANTKYNVSIQIKPLSSTDFTKHTVKVEIKTTSGTPIASFTSSQVNLGPAMDTAGGSWIGFTSSSMDTTAAPAVTISDFVVKTAGVGSTVDNIPTGKTTIATAAFTDTNAFSHPFNLRDSCKRSISSATEELAHVTFEFTGTSALECSVGPWDYSIQNSNLSYTAKLGCKKVSTTPLTLTMQYPGQSAVTIYSGINVVPGPAVARESQLTKLEVVGDATPLCGPGSGSPEKSCTGSTLFTVTAGKNLAITLDLKDRFRNAVATNDRTQLTVALNPTPGSITPLLTGPTGTVNFMPQIVTGPAGSLLSISVNSQALTQTATIVVKHGRPHASQTVITGGTGLAQYIAGEEQTFTLNLKDQFGNVVEDVTTVAGLAADGITFDLRLNSAVCNPSQASPVGFATNAKCPTIAFPANQPGFVELKASPTKAELYHIVCTVGGSSNWCVSVTSPGYPITVVATNEEISRAEIVDLETLPNDANKVIKQYQPVPTGLTATPSQAHYGTPTTDIYMTAGTVKQFTIKSVDRFGNVRSNTANSGAAYIVRFYFGATDITSASTANYQQVVCDNSAPTASPATIQYIGGGSRCRFSPTTGYQVDFVPTKVANYWGDLSVAGSGTLRVVILQGTVLSTYRYFSLVQASADIAGVSTVADVPQSTFTTVTATDACEGSTRPIPTDAVYFAAGCVKKYNLKLQDTYGNLVKPLIVATATGALDTNQNYFNIYHTLAVNTPSFTPKPVPALQAGELRPRWLFDASTNIWSTKMRLVGAFNTKPNIYVRNRQFTDEVGYNVIPALPVLSATTYAAAYSPNDPNGDWKTTWSLFDAFGNPSYFTTAQLPVQCKNGNNVVGDVSGTGCPGYSTAQHQYASSDKPTFTCTATYSAVLTVEVSTCSLNYVAVEANQRTLTWPKTGSVPLLTAYAIFTQTPGANGLQPLPTHAQLEALTFENQPSTAKTATAGAYLVVRFKNEQTTDEAITTSLLAVAFTNSFAATASVVAPTSITAASNVYLVFHLTTVPTGGAFKITPAYTGAVKWAGGAAASEANAPTITLLPAKISLAHSTITVPAELIACSTVVTDTTPIEVEPKDMFSNTIVPSLSMDVKLQIPQSGSSAPVPLSTTDDIAGGKLTFKFCIQKASYFQFDVTAPSITSSSTPQRESQLTVIIPGAPTTFVLDNALLPTCFSTTDTCSQCTLGSDCVVRAKVVDAFNNPLSDADITARGSITVTTTEPRVLNTVNGATTVEPKCKLAQINTYRNTIAGLVGSSLTATAEIIGSDGSITTSGETVTATIPAAAFQFPSSFLTPVSPQLNCSNYKQVQFVWTPKSDGIASLVGQAMNEDLDVILSSPPTPEEYIVYLPGSSTPLSSHTGNVDLGQFAASSQGVALSIAFVDKFYNFWYTAASQVTGNFASPGAQGVPLMNSPSVLPTTLERIDIKPVFQKKGTFTLPKVVVSGNLLEGMIIKIVPGPITRWDFTFPDYDSTVQAGTKWTVNAVPSDANGNTIVATTAVATDPDIIAIKAAVAELRLKVFEGVVTCDPTSMIPSTTTGIGSKDITTAAAYSVAFESQASATGIVTLKLDTKRANELTVAGTRLTYTYYFLNKFAPNNAANNKVYTCTGATINVIPAAMSPTVSKITGLGSGAIGAGDNIEFDVELADQYGNVIAYHDPKATAPSAVNDYRYKVIKCASTTAPTDVAAASAFCEDNTAVNGPLPQGSCIVGTVQGYVAADFNLFYQSISDETDVYLGIAAIEKAGSPPTSIVISNKCYKIDVYHANPAQMVIYPSTTALNTALNTYINRPEAESADLLANSVELAMTAGVPTEFYIGAVDKYDNIVNYNHQAFYDAENANNYFEAEGKFDSNKFFFRVTATFVRPIEGVSDLIYTTSVDSSYPEFTPTNTGTPVVAYQSVTLVPAWPGFYSISVQIFKRPTKVALTNDNGLPVAMPGSVAPTLKAKNPICSDAEVYVPNADPSVYGQCDTRDTSSDAFTCIGSNGADVTVLISNYEANIAECSCVPPYVQCKNRCLAEGEVCDEAALVDVPTRVCPANYHLCGDKLTCVVEKALCTTTPLPSCTTHMCSDGSCAVDDTKCPTPISCPSGDHFLCPNRLCVTNGEYCQQLRECNPVEAFSYQRETEGPNGETIWETITLPAFTTYRCPVDGSCVTDLTQCPTNVSCPAGTIKCQSGECASSIADCNPPTDCSISELEPWRCPDGSCAVDASFCPANPSCGTDRPLLCPDKKSCVANVADCNVAQVCPVGTILCSTGECVTSQSQCPTATTCRPESPILCIDGSCVADKSSCNAADATVEPCPAAAPVRCATGSCMKHADLCGDLIQCPFYKPIKCPSAECVSAIELCPYIANEATYSCPYGWKKCPVSGTCSPHLDWCPTLRACLPGEIRCANGQCYPLVEGQQDSCPTQARNVAQCQQGQVQCPVTNTGIVCRPSIKDCPTDVTCPASAPFRCESNQCAAHPQDCAHMNANDIPETRVACGMGTWAASSALCGTPPTCPPTQPALCLDGTCRQTPADCPVNNECPSNLPFKCASGECQLNSYSCALSRCNAAGASVRCPYAGTDTRCVSDFSQCPNVFDLSQSASITVACTFGARCWDGSCVSESRLCPARRCPVESPFLCFNGGCAKSEKFCADENGCAFGFEWCKFAAKCIEKGETCSPAKIDGVEYECPPTITINEETGATEVVKSELLLCGDGTCRATEEECYFASRAFGCTDDLPIRCQDGTCVARTPDGSSLCKVASDAYNACPASRPVRCPGGLCSTSLSRCPTFPALISATQTGGICRSVKHEIVDEEDSTDGEPDMIEVTEHMTITCDDGSCAFTHAECPVIKPCGAQFYRCGDGTCRPLPCDPTNAKCRVDYLDSPFMGANCPSVNTCPGQLPYRCQSGECAANREDCISNYPIRLNKCCGGGANYSPISATMINAADENLGDCDTSTTCVEGPRTLEASIASSTAPQGGNSGCPVGSIRCPQGQCVSAQYGDELCAVYQQAFAELGQKAQTCAARCPRTGLCVDDITECTVENGCPIGSPFLCSNGECKATQSDCVDTPCASTVRCPNSNKCVDSLDECITPLGCPLTAPNLCSDGTCKPYPASQKGMTVQPYPSFVKQGIPEDVCQPSVGCSGTASFLCGDGTCQVDSSLCPPIIATCPGTCRVTCPLTNECIQLPSMSYSGVTVCDFDSLIELCQQQSSGDDDKACPSQRPFLCPSGQCVAAPTQCSSTIFNEARTANCPSDKQNRCIDGTCVARPFDCIIATAIVQQKDAEVATTITPTTQITNTNVCVSGYVCPNGLCVSDSTECTPIAACKFGFKRCADGSCVGPTFGTNGEVIEPECTGDEDFVASCAGGSRCGDGICRAAMTCPPVNGCGINKISCPWSTVDRCVDSIDDCPGYKPSSDNQFNILSSPVLASVSVTQSLSQLYKVDALQQRFPHLDVVKIAQLADSMDAQFATSSFVPQQTGGTTEFTPDDTNIETCYDNCERDITATPSTTIINPKSKVTDLAISYNQYSIPRSTVSIPIGAVNRTAEFRIYSTPETLFDGAQASTVGYALPFVWEEPEKRDNDIVATPGEFASKVISTPFACSLQVNNTEIKPALPMTVSAYVDTKAYQISSSITGSDTEFPCAFTGSFDSALVGSGCGGAATISGGTIEVKYDQTSCGWENASDVLSFRASFLNVKTAEEVPDTIPWNGQTARQVICMRVDQSPRIFSDSGASIVGSTFCATFVRITDLIEITLPDNMMVRPPSLDADADTTAPDYVPPSYENLLTVADFATSRETPPTNTELQTISNASLYDPSDANSSDASTCFSSSSDISSILKQDICLGYYDYATYSWQCLKPLNEQRLADPTWVSGMRLNQATAALDSCDKDAYAFLYVPLPDPVPVEDKFCFWCKYGWIILLVCIIFVVVLLIVIFLCMRFYHDRIKYKQEQKKLQGLQEHAQDLQENQGGIGVADADGEINMTVNPLVLQLQDLNKQLEDANIALDTMGKEEEYHIQRLQQQRQRIQAEIKRLEESLAHDETVKLAPKRVEAPAAGPSTGSSVPQGPVRTGGPSGPSGPSGTGNINGPMRAPPK